MKKNELVTCVGCGAIALLAGALCHRLAPGLGLVLMPMVWPMVWLATRVSPVKAVTTAAVVPVISYLLTGMPTVPVLVALKFAALSALVAVGWRLIAFLRNR